MAIFLIICVCLLLAERRWCWFCSYLPSIFGTVIYHHRGFIYIGAMPKCSIYGIFSYIYVHFLEINWWILFILGKVINHHKGLMHIKCNFVLCQNKVIAPIFSLLKKKIYILYMNDWLLFIFGIVTMYNKSLIHGRSNLLAIKFDWVFIFARRNPQSSREYAFYSWSLFPSLQIH